jgi:adenine phosphoribosyltransferase
MKLDEVPAGLGSVFICLPLKVKGGPESETRVMCIAPKIKNHEAFDAYALEMEQRLMPKMNFYPDFPKKGVNFLDVFSITSNPEMFREIMEGLDRMIIEKVGRPKEAFTHIVGVESKGFVLGPILAQKYMVPFVPIRKKGKLPGENHQVAYTTEYSTDCMEIGKKSFPTGSKALIIDDLAATGGTLVASEKLLESIEGSEGVAHVVIFEIDCLNGKDKLKLPFHALMHLRDYE